MVVTSLNKNNLSNILNSRILVLIYQYSYVKDSRSHMHGLTVHVKEGLSFARDLSLEISEDYYLYFWLALLHSLSYFFLLYWSPSSLCARFLILFHLTWMRFSQSTHLLIFLSLETSKSITRTGSPIMVELIDLVNSVIIFLSQVTLLRCLTFLLGSQTVILIVLLFWIHFFLLMLVVILQWLSTVKFWSC